MIRLYKAGLLQTKLKIGKPGDKYEQEADRIAEKVMNIPDPIVQKQEKPEELVQPKTLADEITSVVQIQPVAGEEDETESIEKKREDNPLFLIFLL